MTLALSRRGLAAAAIAVASAAHLPSSAHARTASDADARALIDLILENYAYQERLSGFSEQRLRLLRERDAPLVASASELITFGERALAALFDHHAILNSSLANSYGLVPSFADLWIESDARGRFAIQDVRHGSPALRSGVRPGDVLVGVEGALTDRAIAAFIEAPSDVLNTTQRDCCARVLAAGRRDRPRRLTIARNGVRRTLTLANLYASPAQRGEGPLSVRRLGDALHIRFNDSLGNDDTVAAFDAALAEARGARAIIVDLRDTPGGGNSNVARAVMGWFVDRPLPYQHHELTAESRANGVRRSWIEEVSPRTGAPFPGRAIVLVGRWTGSMGEGIGVGFDAIGASVVGSRMAGLLGAIYDLPLPSSGLTLKLPAERLSHVNGTPREAFSPPTLVAYADAPDPNGRDLCLDAALALVD